ncbi:MAG: hypothetical protein H6839_11825 [Planctomycetes bacterium]|nr:hypothetical protein [Planctomycetota bacterium]
MAQMQGAQNQPAYGPPQKSGGNAGVIVGIVVGVVVLVLVIVVVVAAGGPPPEDLAKQKQEEQNKQLREDMAKKDAETKAANEALKKPMEAAMNQGTAIEAAIRGSDATTLENMFDWQTYAAYNSDLIQANPEFLTAKSAVLMCTGSWDKDKDGSPTGTFTGEAPFGSDSLRTRVMDYIKNFYFGAQNIRWEKARSEADGAAFSLTVGSNSYVGKRIYIAFDKGGKEKEFWVGAPKGSSDVRILNFIDKDAFTSLQTKEAPKKRTDDRNPLRNPDRDPDKDPAKNPDGDPEDPPADPDANLPEVANTGGMPTEAALVNCIEELKRDNPLNDARLKQIKGETSKAEKKATMGAMIDLLIAAVKNNNRNAKRNISAALYDVWDVFVPQGWEKEDMVYTIDFNGQSDSDLPIRRWLDVYNNYKVD